MSQENVEIVRSIYRSLDEDDWDAAFRLADPEFEATFQRGLNRGAHRGRDSVRAIAEDQRKAFDGWAIAIERLIESGDQVVAVIGNRLRPKGTDAEIQNPAVHASLGSNHALRQPCLPCPARPLLDPCERRP